MKRLLHISFAAILSAFILVGTVGMYITKDVCAPCGKSSIEVDFVKVLDVDVEQDCEHAHDYCETDHTANTCCSDHDTSHEHHGEHQHKQEQVYLHNTPVFFNKTITHTFQPQLLAVLMPIFAFVFEDNAVAVTTYGETPPPLPSAKGDYCAFLCTYLI